MQKEDWLYEISPKEKLLSFNFSEIWRYRDLLGHVCKARYCNVLQANHIGAALVFNPADSYLNYTVHCVF